MYSLVQDFIRKPVDSTEIERIVKNQNTGSSRGSSSSLSSSTRLLVLIKTSSNSPVHCCSIPIYCLFSSSLELSFSNSIRLITEHKDLRTSCEFSQAISCSAAFC